MGEGDWLTSPVVVEELKKIKKRRKKIYKKIVTFDYKQTPTAEILYKRCFKSVCGSNPNDERHLSELYEYCIAKLNLKKDAILTNDALSELIKEIYKMIREIKIKLGGILSHFEESSYYQKHVVENKINKKMRKELKGLREARDHKEDIKILANAIEYSHRHGIKLDFVTCESFILTNKEHIEKAIQRSYAQEHIKPSVNILHLNKV